MHTYVNTSIHNTQNGYLNTDDQKLVKMLSFKSF